MNTAKILTCGHRDDSYRTTTAGYGHDRFNNPIPHLRLVVDNTSLPAAPVFKLPPWFDRMGRVILYSAAGMVIINIVNQLLLGQ